MASAEEGEVEVGFGNCKKNERCGKGTYGCAGHWSSGRGQAGDGHPSAS